MIESQASLASASEQQSRLIETTLPILLSQNVVGLHVDLGLVLKALERALGKS
jgi:hypothetical protein